MLRPGCLFCLKFFSRAQPASTRKSLIFRHLLSAAWSAASDNAQSGNPGGLRSPAKDLILSVQIMGYDAEHGIL